MRTLGLVFVVATGLGLSGCSQISSIFKKKPHYHTADGTAVYVDSADTATTFVDNSYTDPTLRAAPAQSYQFADQSHTGASQYTGYGVELYNQQLAYTPVPYSDPREAGFVSLNGKSEAVDWRNCETMSRGYLFISKYDFMLDPNFEVCMRNKGYVLTTESGPTSKQVLSARTVGLRGVYQTSTSSNTYSSSGSYQPSTSSYAYPTTY